MSVKEKSKGTVCITEAGDKSDSSLKNVINPVLNCWNANHTWLSVFKSLIQTYCDIEA